MDSFTLRHYGPTHGRHAHTHAQVLWTLDGALSQSTSGTLMDTYVAACASGEAPARIDVSGLTGIDAAGFGALYALRHRVAGGIRTIACDAPRVRTLFRDNRAEHLLDASRPNP